MSKSIRIQRIRKIIILISTFLLFLLSDKGLHNANGIKEDRVSPVQKTSIDSSVMEFLHVDKTKLFTASGEQFRMKGMAFGNNVWYNPKTAPITDHDEKSYKELAKLKFNCVRFYINYALFEDDNKPYQYKETGFKWLDKNIKWAKKNGIRLIVNMHYPQGGIMSANNISFWQTENQKRYCSLWTAIVKRYKDEPTIMGFDLLNEPFMPYNDNSTQVLDSYYAFINDTIALIREQDTKHVIFIERPYGCVNAATKQVTYPWGDMGSFRTVEDTNVVYEYHFYDPFEYTSQKLSWIKTFRNWNYNDDTRIIPTGTREWKAPLEFKPVYVKYETRGKWIPIASELMQLKDVGNAGYWYMTIRNYNKWNDIYIDNVVIKEYNEYGKYLRDVYSYDFTNITYCDGWDLKTDGGRYSYDSKNGYLSTGCAKISGVGNLYKFYITYNDNNFFEVKNGNYYQITALVKTSNDIVITPGLQMHQIEKIYYMNSQFLEYKLNIFREWSEKNQVPIYLGEFAVTRYIMGNQYKGENWVKDMFMILNKYDMNYNYHDYHEENYGLYMEDGRVKRRTINQILYNIFQSEVRKN